MSFDLSARNRQPEIMDSPDLEPARFVNTLRGLRRVNIATQSAEPFWPELYATAKKHPERTTRVLDVACGGGDVLISLWRRSQRAGLDVEYQGCDISPVAIRHANELAVKAKADFGFFELDATQSELPDGFDMIMSSFFLHHLTTRQAIAFVAEAAAKSRDRMVIHDLERGPLGYWFAYFGTYVLLCNDICRSDGRRSVEGAFTQSEARSLLGQADLVGGEVRPQFPFRFVMRWIKNESPKRSSGSDIKPPLSPISSHDQSRAGNHGSGSTGQSW